MKSFLVIITMLAFLVLTSCNQAKQDTGQTNQESVAPTAQEQDIADSVGMAGTVEVDTVQQSSAEQNDEEPMLNPPHGEPNHRCDIPVGAPLNSPKEGMQEAQPDKEEVMLNPPHGEPNHRCDIPVGAPLNSTTANSTRQTTNSQVQTTAPDLANNPMAPTVENAKRLNSTQTRRTTTTSASGEKPRLNPPHGQAWHRCDIAVGSPLP